MKLRNNLKISSFTGYFFKNLWRYYEKIYLFRHGETDWNVLHKMQGSKDIELNENGIQQAKQNAEFLKDFGIEYIYSSPLKRAFITGKILADKIGVEIEVANDLIEANFGKYEGVEKSKIKEDFGEENYENFFHSMEGLDISFPLGEKNGDMRNRIVNAVKNICKTTKYNTVAVASRGCVLREFLRALDFEDDSGLKNCEVVEAEFDDDELRIVGRIKNNLL